MFLAGNADSPPVAPTGGASVFLEEKAFRARTVLVFWTVTDALASETVRKLLARPAHSAS